MQTQTKPTFTALEVQDQPHITGPWYIEDEEGTVRAEGICCREHARLIAKAPELYAELDRLINAVNMVNARQHAGVRIKPEEWADLFQQANEARAMLADIEGA